MSSLSTAAAPRRGDLADDPWAPFRAGPVGGVPPAGDVPPPAPVAPGLAEAVRALNVRVGHPLADPLAGRLGRAVPVVAAHQPCLFGGPLFVLVKALGAWAESERLRRAGVDAVPLLWIGADDHDRREVAGVDVWHPGADAPVRHDASADFAELVPVGPQPPGPAVRAALDAVGAGFGGPRSSPWLEALRRAYDAPSMTEAFARWLVAVLGARAPLLLDPLAGPVRAATAELAAAVVAAPEASLREARARAEALDARGLRAPVAVDDVALPFFRLDAAGRRRRALRLGPGRFGLRGVDGTVDAAALLADGATRLSPNVLLRPLVQERVLGPGVSVLGPSEHAYHAQTAAWHRRLLGPDAAASRLRRRPSATVLGTRDAERLADHGLDPVAAAGGVVPGEPAEAPTDADDGARRRLLAAVDAYAAAVAGDAPDLAAAADKFRSRVERAAEGLAASRERARDARLRARRAGLEATLARVRPGGAPQDRALGGVSFVLRFGDALVEALAGRLAADPAEGAHHVVVLP